jgi:hypothetical protein
VSQTGAGSVRQSLRAGRGKDHHEAPGPQRVNRVHLPLFEPVFFVEAFFLFVGALSFFVGAFVF